MIDVKADRSKLKSLEATKASVSIRQSKDGQYVMSVSDPVLHTARWFTIDGEIIPHKEVEHEQHESQPVPVA